MLSESAEGAEGVDLARALQLEATKHFDSGRLDEAIDCARRAAAADPDEPLDRAVRLPMWLQEFGRFEDAKRTFEALLDDVPRRASVAVPKPRDRRSIEHAMLSEVYRKMATAYRRQGLKDDAEKFASLARKHYLANQRSVRASLKKATS